MRDGARVRPAEDLRAHERHRRHGERRVQARLPLLIAPRIAERRRRVLDRRGDEAFGDAGERAAAGERGDRQRDEAAGLERAVERAPAVTST